MSSVEQTVRRPAIAAQPRVQNPPRRILRRVATAFIVLGVIAAALTVASNYYLDSRQFEWTDDAFIDGHVISISPQVSARVQSVLVNDNAAVKKGDLLVQLDPTDYQVVLDQKKATESSMLSKVSEAKTQLEVARANLGQANAELNVCETTATNMDQDYQRYTSLDPRARSQQQLDNATAAERSAAATVRQAQSKITAAQAQVDAAQAAVQTSIADAQTASADRHEAEIQLGYCRITAPQDGVVTRKAIEEGSYVTLGQPLFSIVPTEVWVAANFKETQLDEMRPGMSVSINVNAYPEHPFHGTVESIQYGTGSKFTLLPPENATGNFVKVVQRVPVKIVFDPGEIADTGRPLALGMSVEPSVKVRPRPTIWSLFGITGTK